MSVNEETHVDSMDATESKDNDNLALTKSVSESLIVVFIHGYVLGAFKCPRAVFTANAQLQRN